MTNSIINQTMQQNVDDLLGTRTRVYSLDGVDKTTELWRPTYVI